MALTLDKSEIIEGVEVMSGTNGRVVNYKPVTKHYRVLAFLEALSLILVIAKLTGYTTMSWFWVFAPVILHAIIILAVIAIIVILFIIAAIIAAICD